MGHEYTGGFDGLPSLPISPLFGVFEFNPLYSNTQYLYALAVLFICFVFVRTLVYSPFGQSLTGIRENMLRMHAVGSPVRERLVTLLHHLGRHCRHRRRAVGASLGLCQSERARPRSRRHRADHADPGRLWPALRRLRRRRRLHGAVALSGPDSIRPPGSSGSACCWWSSRCSRATAFSAWAKRFCGASASSATSHDHAAARDPRLWPQFRRACRGPRHQLPARARRPPRADRPQRRRQDHVHQPAHRRAAADHRRGPAQWPRHHRGRAGRARQARHRPHLPDQPAVPRALGAGERLYRGVRAARRRAVDVAAGRQAQGRDRRVDAPAGDAEARTTMPSTASPSCPMAASAWSSLRSRSD